MNLNIANPEETEIALPKILYSVIVKIYSFSLSLFYIFSKWKPSVTPANASTVYQMMRVESLSLYWNPTATALDDVEIAHITPMQYYNWKHYMLTGLDKFSMHHEDFEFRKCNSRYLPFSDNEIFVK